MAIEVELKLAIAPEHASTLRRVPALKAWSGNALPTRRKLLNTYFDTPSLALQQAGFALRIRKVGRVWIQTLKGGGNSLASLHQRLELEWPVPSPALDLDAITGAPQLDDDLRAFFVSQGTALAPIFTTTFFRSAWPLTLPDGSTAELALDIGEIQSGDRTEALSELEIELRQGQPQALYETALALLEHLPLAPEPRSKAERGYALFTGANPTPVKASRPGITPDMSTEHAFSVMLLGALDQIQRNRTGLLDASDPEYLHQMRVGLRRARSVVLLYRKLVPAELMTAVNTHLHWLNQALGAARDWDVFTLSTLPPIIAHFEPSHPLQRLPEVAAQQRALSGELARTAVASTQYTKMILEIPLWLLRQPWQDNPIASRTVLMHAREVLEQHWQKLLKSGKHLRKLTAVERHALRIRCKNMRYAVEFFAPLFPKKRCGNFCELLVSLQEALGATTDAATAERLVATLLSSTADPLLQQEGGMVIGWTGHLAHAAQESLRHSWKPVRRAKRFW